MFRYFLAQRKQAKSHWLQDPNQNNADNLNNVSHESSRHFRNKKKEILKAKIDELETKSQFKNIGDLYRGIIVFKKGCQTRSNTVKNEMDDLVTDSHSILAMWRNHFSHLFNIHVFIDVRHTDRQTNTQQNH
jgi:hypothetical protein